MASLGTIKTLAGPAYIASSAANILAAPASGILYNVTQIQIVNATAASATFKIYKGATGGSTGGTEIAAGSVPPVSMLPVYFSVLHLTSTDFISAISSTASTLTATVLGASRTSDPS